MLMIVIVAATAVLTLGLVLHGVTAEPYQVTRDATAGPDVLATDFPSGSGPSASHAALTEIAPLVHARGVVAHSGPFPVAFSVLTSHGHTDAVLAEGRDRAPLPATPAPARGGGCTSRLSPASSSRWCPCFSSPSTIGSPSM